MCHVRVVLMCKGRGADAASYRPQRDETQWWNRRDALVRCATSFLYGPASPYTRQLVLIHDEDYSRIEMTFAPDVIPTEQQLLTLWKNAATHPTSNQDPAHTAACRLVLDSMDQSTPSLPTSMDNKRQLLEHLQKHCSIDFLRTHGLNSNASVVLRKTNKKALLEVWNQWTKQISSSTTSSRKSSSNPQHNAPNRLRSIYQELLQKPISGNVQTTVAGILHESFDSELPCYDTLQQSAPTVDGDQLQVCLFLGAVRDMHPWESRVLRECCSQATIPLVRVRLGPVPEFTSKILSVVAYHHAQGVLGPALLQLCQAQGTGVGVDEKRHRKRLPSELCQGPTDSTPPRPPPTISPPPLRKLHVICTVPLPSDALSSDLSHRSRPLWCLVRVTVCTLWRSRLASSTLDDTSQPLENSLTIFFEDGITLTLHQEELVKSLAEQHQAAPSEHQVLAALCQKRDKLSGANQLRDRKEQAVQLVASLKKNSPTPTIALDVQVGQSEDTDLPRLLYSNESNSSPPNKEIMTSGHVLALMRIRKEHASQETKYTDNDSDEMMQSLVEACEKSSIPVCRQALLACPVQDMEAAAITMLQHFIYQNRLFPALGQLTPQLVVADSRNGKHMENKKYKTSRKKRR